MKNFVLKFIFVFIISSSLQCQLLQSLTIKGGLSYAGQQISPKAFGVKQGMYRLAVGIEPEVYRFGGKEQMRISCDLLYVGKGGVNSSPIYRYDEFGQLIGTGGENYSAKLNYFSISPNFNYWFTNQISAKLGFRADFLTGIKIEDRFDSDNRTKDDFSSTNVGLNLGINYVWQLDNSGFFAELLYQQDFNHSGTYQLINTNYTNFAVLLNIGVVIATRKKK